MLNKSEVQIIINTLNQIEVKGKSNLDRLLGVINYLSDRANEPEPELEEVGG